MEYIHVSQFYQSVVCFSILLLIIQQCILCCSDLEQKYSEYRRKFYDAQFQFMGQQWQQPEVKEQQIKEPKEEQLRDSLMEKDQKSSVKDKSQSQQEPKEDMRRQSIDVSQLETDRQLKNDDRRASVAKENPKTQNYPKIQQQNKEQKSYPEIEQSSEKKSKVGSSPPSESNIETLGKDEQNTPTPKQEQNDEEKRSRVKSVASVGSRGSRRSSTSKKSKASKKSEQKIEQTQEKVEENEFSEIKSEKIEPKMQQIPDNDRSSRKQTELNTENLDIEGKRQSQQKKPEKVERELSPEEQAELQEANRRKIKYCRRIDDAFNEYIAIIVSVVVLGICTHSVYIFSMFLFFGYAFTSLLFNYAHLLERLEDAPDKKSIFAQINQLISSLFIFGLFISYWADSEFV